MEDLTHDELRIALKEIPDYGKYEDMPRWSLFDSVCLIIEVWPDREVREYWSQTVKDRFKEVYDSMLSDIQAGALPTTREHADNDYWLNKEDVIKWVKDHHLPVGSEFFALHKAGRELQKETTVIQRGELQKDVDNIARRYIEEGKPIPTKGEIANELLKLPRWQGKNYDTLMSQFTSPKNRKILEEKKLI